MAKAANTGILAGINTAKKNGAYSGSMGMVGVNPHLPSDFASGVANGKYTTPGTTTSKKPSGGTSGGTAANYGAAADAINNAYAGLGADATSQSERIKELLNQAYNNGVNQVNSAYESAKNELTSGYEKLQQMAEEAYNSSKGETENMYGQRFEALGADRDAANNEAQNNYAYSEGEANKLADRSNTNAYVSYMQGLRNMGQQMAASGLSGGASESTLLGAQNNYGTQRGQIAQNLGDTIGTLLQTLNSSKDANERQYNQNVASTESEKASALMQLLNDMQSKKQGYQQSLLDGTTNLTSNKDNNLLTLLQNRDNGIASEQSNLNSILQNYKQNAALETLKKQLAAAGL